MKEPSILELVEKELNGLGELHLDPHKTQLLLNWLKKADSYQNDVDTIVTKLTKLLQLRDQTIDAITANKNEC